METHFLEETPEPCARCGGFEWIAAHDEPLGNKAVRCPECQAPETKDWFVNLQVSAGNKQAIKLAREFAARPNGWLVIVGEVGTGKTWLLNAILSQWRDGSRNAVTSAQLLDIWRQALDNETFSPTFNGYCTAPAFVLDDLGAENVTTWGVAQMTMFLDHRYGRALPTCIATNYDRAELSRRLGERIADRVYDSGTGLVKVVSLNVPSFRGSKA